MNRHTSRVRVRLECPGVVSHNAVTFWFLRRQYPWFRFRVNLTSEAPVYDLSSHVGPLTDFNRRRRELLQHRKMTGRPLLVHQESVDGPEHLAGRSAAK
jgi:hypothetical protein